MELADLKERFAHAERNMLSYGGIFDLDKKNSHISALEKDTFKEDFWDKPADAQIILKKIH